MSKNTGTPYEILTQQIFQALLNQTEVKNIRVEHNVILKGKTPNVEHQIDVYWEYELAGVIYRTVVQAKDWEQTVSQGHLIAFKGVLDDLPNQPRGIFVTRTGYQSGAKAFAEANGIILYELREPTEKDMDGKVMTIRLTMSAFLPKCSNPQTIIDQSWVDAELKRLGIPASKSLSFTISGLENEVFFFDESGKQICNFHDVIRKLFPLNFVEVPETDKEHLFTEPTFMLTGNPRFPKIKLRGIRAIISVGRENQVMELKGEDFISFILHDVIGNKTRLIDKDNSPIKNRHFK